MMSGPQIAHIMGPNGQLQQVQVMAAPATSLPAPTPSSADPSRTYGAPSSNFVMQTNPVMSLSQATSTVTTQV